MKYALSALLIAVLGFGEYVYVEVMPLPEHKRLGKLVELTHTGAVFHYWKVAKLETAAKEGNPYAYGALLTEGRKQDNEELIERALALLKSSDSFTAKRYLYVDEYFSGSEKFKKENSFFTAEFLALTMLALEENFTLPLLSAERQNKFREGAQEGIKDFYEQVAIGNPKYVEAARLIEEYQTVSG